jgi:very-short-patch-repair endonuclease
VTGDLILHYEEIAREEDANCARWMTAEDGLRAVWRRIFRARDPEGAALAEREDAISSVKEIASEEDKESIWQGVNKALRVCESPIEMLLLPWLVVQPYFRFRYRPRVLMPGEGHLLEDQCVALVPQLPIGRRRADFALAARRGPHMKFVVVECDGAAFHDGVKNVMRDVDRDVEILSSKKVLSVIRFTGSEIHRSPRKCAADAADELYRCWLKGNDDTDWKFSEGAA